MRALHGRGIAKVKKGNSVDENRRHRCRKAISAGVAENFAEFLKPK
jgi:hypothetical protein